MQGQHSHGVAYYRCRFPQEYALANKINHPRNVIMREEGLIDPLDQWLTQAFAPPRQASTIAAIADQVQTDLPTPGIVNIQVRDVVFPGGSAGTGGCLVV
jgi:hypothetical protein